MMQIEFDLGLDSTSSLVGCRAIRIATALVVGGLVWALSGCLYPARDGILANLPCTEQAECADGYECRGDICVAEGTPRLDAGVDVDAGADAGADAGVVDAGPDGGQIAFGAPLRLQGVALGAQRMQSLSFRADVRVGGGSSISGRNASTSYQMIWGAK